MGATFSRVIDNMKTKSELNTVQMQANETNVKPLNDDNITQFVFVIEEDILIEEDPIISIEPIIEKPIIEEPIVSIEPILEEPINDIELKKVVPMDIKDLMKEIIAESLISEGLAEETLSTVSTVSDRKLRKRRKKSL